jgi:rod shape determining protein RodA
VDFIFDNVLEQHHRDRINVIFNSDIDIKREGYNLNQSLIAIGSGGLFGKGFLEGTQTKGGFVPEQHSDYIFTTLGEEWGFIGTLVVILLYVALILRLLYLAENQKTRFARIVGYGVASILFMHFFLNIAMLIKLFPTIGVPLPYFSYGGSSFWAFTILLFIFIKLDANKVNEW